MRVFVYGSLMDGMHNHGLLATAEFVRADQTTGGFDMRSLGAFPAAVRSPEGPPLRGELYEVNAAELAALDRLEGHPFHYRRTETELAGGGMAFVYVYADPERLENRPRVPNNDWRAFREKDM